MSLMLCRVLVAIATHAPARLFLPGPSGLFYRLPVVAGPSPKSHPKVLRSGARDANGFNYR